MKKITSVILALLLTAAMAMPAFAAEGEENESPCPHANKTVETIQEATCTEAGLTEGAVCACCGQVLTAQETVPALGHKEEAVSTVKEPPQCDFEGILIPGSVCYTVTYRCTLCGLERVEHFTHVPGPEELVDGETVVHCTICSGTISSTGIG